MDVRPQNHDIMSAGFLEVCLVQDLIVFDTHRMGLAIVKVPQGNNWCPVRACFDMLFGSRAP